MSLKDVSIKLTKTYDSKLPSLSLNINSDSFYLISVEDGKVDIKENKLYYSKNKLSFISISNLLIDNVFHIKDENGVDSTITKSGNLSLLFQNSNTKVYKIIYSVLNLSLEDIIIDCIDNIYNNPEKLTKLVNRHSKKISNNISAINNLLSNYKPVKNIEGLPDHKIFYANTSMSISSSINKHNIALKNKITMQSLITLIIKDKNRYNINIFNNHDLWLNTDIVVNNKDNSEVNYEKIINHYVLKAMDPE